MFKRSTGVEASLSPKDEFRNDGHATCLQLEAHRNRQNGNVFQNRRCSINPTGLKLDPARLERTCNKAKIDKDVPELKARQ